MKGPARAAKALLVSTLTTACSGTYLIHSTRAPDLQPATHLYVVSDVGLRGDGDSGEFSRAVQRGLEACHLPATVVMLSLIERNEQLHLRNARAAGAAQLLLVLNRGASTSLEGTASASYRAALYELAQERVLWQATVNADRFGAELAAALMSRLAREGGLPPACFPTP